MVDERHLPQGFTGFHPLEELHRQDDQARQTRVFTGDDTPYLRCPGLQQVAAIRAAGTNLPEVLEFPVLADLSGTSLRVDRWPAWDLSLGHDGVPVLRRSQFSNDGVWNKGLPVYVTGIWDEEVSPVTEAPSHIPTRNEQRPVMLEVGVPEGAISRGKGR